MARSDRLLRLMQCLRTARPPVTAAYLAGELDVSIRTLYRDIETLRSSGALIDGEAGVGYTLQEDPALPPMLFSRDEMEALVLGLREVREVGDPVLSTAAENALSKLKASLPPRMQAEFEHAVLYAKRYVQRPSVQIDIQTLREETREERVITIDYVDEHQVATRRDIRPLAIVYFEKSLVVLAWCDLRSDFRMFRIDRIQQMTATGVFFRPERVPMLRTFLARLSTESD
ncbi:MAG: YafY family protein [Pseudomonadota bacterium]